MWSELTYLVEKRLESARSDEDTAAVRAAIMAVYGALANCQIAFERLESGAADDGEADAVLAMDVVLATLHNVQPVLGLFEPGPARELARYLHGPTASASSTTTRAELKNQVETLRRLMAIEVAGDAAEAMTLAAFSGARRRLGELIRARQPLEALFDG